MTVRHYIGTLPRYTAITPRIFALYIHLVYPLHPVKTSTKHLKSILMG